MTVIYNPAEIERLVDIVKRLVAVDAEHTGEAVVIGKTNLGALVDQLKAAQGEIDQLREERRPQRIMLAPSSEPAWKINNIEVSNTFMPPPTAEYKRREEEAAARHDPLICRTMLGGPGNRRRVMGCTCRAPEIRDAASWCAHIGVPGGERFLKPLLSLQDAVQDVHNYPGDRSLAALRAAYDATKNWTKHVEQPTNEQQP